MPEARKKIFDVAKPGSTDPDIGTKPMAAGHSYISSDPTITGKTEVKGPPAVRVAQEEPSTPISKSPKKVIAPLVGTEAAQEDYSESEVADPASEQPKTNDTAPVRKKQSTTPETDKEALPEDTSEETIAALSADEKELALEEIIRSKQYYVPIKERHGSHGNGKPFVIIITLCALAVIALYLLADASIIDLGVDLPLDLIK